MTPHHAAGAVERPGSLLALDAPLDRWAGGSTGNVPGSVGEPAIDPGAGGHRTPAGKSPTIGGMRLTALEEERLLIFTAAELARRHLAADLPLNQPETVALICDAMLEAARAGATYEECVAAGRSAVSADQVIDGVRELVAEVRLEVLLGDGSRLIVLVDPLGPGPDPVVGERASTEAGAAPRSGGRA